MGSQRGGRHSQGQAEKIRCNCLKVASENARRMIRFSLPSSSSVANIRRAFDRHYRHCFITSPLFPPFPRVFSWEHLDDPALPSPLSIRYPRLFVLFSLSLSLFLSLRVVFRGSKTGRNWANGKFFLDGEDDSSQRFDGFMEFFGGIEVRSWSSHFVEFWIIVFPILIERQSNYIKLKIY